MARQREERGAAGLAPRPHLPLTAPSPPPHAHHPQRPRPAGNLVHGGTGKCATLGLPSYSADAPYATNNGTLQQEVWAGPVSTGRTVAVLFNKGPQADTIAVGWPELGLPAGATLPVRDVWAMADLPAAQNLTALVAPHGVRVFLVG